MNTISYIIIMISFTSITFCAADSDSDSTITHLDNIDSPWTPAMFIFPGESSSVEFHATVATTPSPLKRNDTKRTFIHITTSSSSSPSYSSSSSYSNSSSDSEDEPTPKYQKTVLAEREEAPYDIMRLALPSVESDTPMSMHHVFAQMHMLQVRMTELSYTVASLQKQLQSGSYLNLAPPMPSDELVNTWFKTIPQFVQATPEDALRITDEFLASVPPEHNYKHHFFVQHIFLTKAQLWYNKYTTCLKVGYQSLPTYCSLQMHQSLKYAQYYFDLVDPISLGSDKLHPTKIATALQNYLQLNKQLRRAQQHILHNINSCGHPVE